jgi:hypothetical protein
MTGWLIKRHRSGSQAWATPTCAPRTCLPPSASARALWTCTAASNATWCARGWQRRAHCTGCSPTARCAGRLPWCRKGVLRVALRLSLCNPGLGNLCSHAPSPASSGCGRRCATMYASRTHAAPLMLLLPPGCGVTRGGRQPVTVRHGGGSGAALPAGADPGQRGGGRIGRAGGGAKIRPLHVLVGGGARRRVGRVGLEQFKVAVTAAALTRCRSTGPSLSLSSGRHEGA